MSPYLTLKCSNGHEWNCLIPKYWMSIDECECGICKLPANVMKFGGLATIGEIQASLRSKSSDVLKRSDVATSEYDNYRKGSYGD